MAEIHPFYETYRGGCGNGAMVEPLRHRRTKGAATDMFYLTPPRHISTLPISEVTKGYSINLSARRTKFAGISRPISFAVFRLTTSSNLLGCSIGISAGLVPRNILTSCRPNR